MVQGACGQVSVTMTFGPPSPERAFKMKGSGSAAVGFVFNPDCPRDLHRPARPSQPLTAQ